MKGWLLRFVTIIVASGAMLTGAYGEVIPESHPKAQLAKKVLFEFLDCMPKRHALIVKSYFDRLKARGKFEVSGNWIHLEVGDLWATVYDSTGVSDAVRPCVTRFSKPARNSILAKILNLDLPEVVTEEELKSIAQQMLFLAPNANYEPIVTQTSNTFDRRTKFQISWKFRHSDLIPRFQNGWVEFEKSDGSLFMFQPYMPIRIAEVDPRGLVPRYSVSELSQIAIDNYLLRKPYAHASFGGFFDFVNPGSFRGNAEFDLTPEDRIRVESRVGSLYYRIQFSDLSHGRARIEHMMIDAIDGRPVGRYEWALSVGHDPRPELHEILSTKVWRTKIAPRSPALRFERSYQPNIEFTRQVALISDIGDIILADTNDAGTFIRLHKDCQWFVLGDHRIPDSANLRATDVSSRQSLAVAASGALNSPDFSGRNGKISTRTGRDVASSAMR